MAAGGNWKEMFHATEKGDLELVKYHLKMGVDPNYQHPEYATNALLESIQKGRLEMAELLLKNGANPAIVQDFSKETPISIAVAQKNKAAIYLLNQYLSEKDQYLDIDPQHTVLVTGGNRGIGKAIAEILLKQGYRVIISVRKVAEGQTVVEALKVSTGNPAISFIQGDLSNIQSCLNLIKQVQLAHPEIDTLINNAGVMMLEKQLNEDGLEISFMVNYLAPYLLCKGLLPILKANQPARIVNVNSKLYGMGKLDIEKTPYGLDFNKIKTYATSKLCNACFTIDFAQEIAESGVTINAVHPGVINTGIGDGPGFLSQIVKFIKRFWKTPLEGADAPNWLAVDPKLDTIHGKYFDLKKEVEYHVKAMDAEVRKALQLKTEEILEKHLEAI
ncbi:MAG: hypothetical protein Sapg2KO_43020 [Saprospiraceae bacterium]